jgi:hypothetical protein
MAKGLWLVQILIALSTQVSFVIAQHDRTQNYSTPHPTNQVSVTASICDARTINYITHSLPQLCFTNTWVSTSFTQNVTSAPATPTPSTETASSNDAKTSTVNDDSSTHAQGAAESDTPEENQDGDPSANTFMSFEDWKEMMLRQTGQDPQDLKSHKSNSNRPHGRTPPDLGHFGLGEEEEISLDFDNYLAKPNSDKPASQTDFRDSDVAEYSHGDPSVSDPESPPLYRSKDAGKTCKERFSYSSFDAGATVLKTGPGTKNAKAILVEHKDSYMLLECSRQSKYVIVELSDDILIDTVVLANFEFFSSMVRHVRVSVSDRYPVKMDRWRTIGTFEARNSRDIQPFLVENPQIWAKYVRLEFVTHYGNEYYCPVSLLRIHGSRMLDSWKDTEIGPDDGADDDHDHSRHETISGGEVAEEDSISASEPLDEPPTTVPESTTGHETHQGTMTGASREHTHGDLPAQVCPVSPSDVLTPNIGICLPKSWIPPDGAACHDCLRNSSNTSLDHSSSLQPQLHDEQAMTTPPKIHSAMPDPPTISPSTTSESVDVSSSSRSSTHQRSPSTNQTSAREAINATTSATINTKTTTPTSPGAKQRGGSSGGSPPAPTVQEGFFNAITKRLHNVETNLTLSLQYLENQSRHLQEAFHKAEQKQLLKVTNFLENLNQTVFSELRGIRMQYDQIWQSTVIALESQREQSERDIVALSTRLNLLADEVVFQKRMAIVQAVLLLCCLFLVIFSRGVPIPYLAPLLEQNNNAVLYTASPPDLSGKTYSIRRGSLAEKTPSPRPPENAHTTLNHIVSARAALSRTARAETGGQLGPYHEGGLSPPATPGPENSDSEEIGTTTGLDMHDSLPHRVAGYQTSHSRKPLPALPEHPSPPS